MAKTRPVTIDDIKPTPQSIRDKTGERSGKVEILGFSRRCRDTPGGATFWVARCDCGEIYELNGGNLKLVGMCKECGISVARIGALKHGMTGTKIYRTWKRITQFHKGRICDKWMTFEGFYEDVGDAPEDKPYLRLPIKGELNAATCSWSDVQNHATLQDKDGNPTTLRRIAEELGVTHQRVQQKIAKARKLGVDEIEYAYSDHSEDRMVRAEEKYAKYLVEGVTHHVLESHEEAIELARNIRAYLKYRGLGSLGTRILGNHVLFEYEANE